MRNSKKLVVGILFVVISGVLLYFSNNIIAFAKSMFILDYEHNKVYKSGDEIILKQDYNNYVPYAFVGYLDKDGTLLDFHSVVHQTSSGITINSYYVGESCIDNIKRNNPNGWDSDLYTYKRCDNSWRNYINYISDEEKLHSIKNWKMIDNSYKDIRHYCTTYNIDLPLCREVISAYQSGNTLYSNYPILMFQEYNDNTPKFEIKCDEENCQYGEKISCRLNSNSRDNIDKFSMSFSNNLFTISDVVVQDGWNYRVNEEGLYTFTNKSAQKGQGEIFGFSITPKQNGATSSMLKITNLSFVTKSGYEDSVDLSTAMNVVEDINNPNTDHDVKSYEIISTVIFFIFAITITFVIFSYKKKKILDN